MTIVSIHQPSYLTWLGFFKKMMNSDIFVFLDDVKYVNTGHNKNKIRTATGFTELTVPVKANSESLFNEVKIDNTKNWASKHKKSIFFNYSKAGFFDKYKAFIENLYGKNFDTLVSLNLEIIEYVKKEFKLNTKTILSSELKVSGVGSERILNICKALNTDIYISGTVWAKDNLKVEDFKKNGIVVEFQNFQHPAYRQCYYPFIPNMAAIDLLFNEGPNSHEILKNSITINV